MPGRYIDTDTAKGITDEFLNTEFEGGRHINRINTIPVAQ
jgi:ribose 5-phosphate isomerase B